MSTPWEKGKKDERIKKMLYICKMEYYSHKKNKTVICRHMDGDRVCLNTVKSDRK